MAVPIAEDFGVQMEMGQQQQEGGVQDLAETEKESLKEQEQSNTKPPIAQIGESNLQELIDEDDGKMPKVSLVMKPEMETFSDKEVQLNSSNGCDFSSHQWTQTRESEIVKLYNLGKHRDLLNYIRESAALGQNSRGTLKVEYRKGVALSESGEYSEALEVLKDVYDKQKETLGEEDYLETARLLGIVYFRMKKYEEAIQIFENTLEKTERICGKKLGNILALMNNFAFLTLGSAKDVSDEVTDFYEELLERVEQLFGEEDPSTLSTKYNIALTKFKLKNYPAALKEFQEVLEERERVLELNHPQTLITKYFIAAIYHRLERREESLQLFKQIQDNRIQILGLRHPETINTQKWIKLVEREIAFQKSSILF